MKICSLHKTKSEWKTGTSKTTNKPYAFWACPNKDNGEYCHADQIDAPEDSPVEPTKNNDSFFKCNALNNAVLLVTQGKVEISDLEKTYKRLLSILET